MRALQLGTIGCIMDGEAEELEREAAAVVVRADCEGLVRGLSRAELNPWPRGTLTQRAIDMEALCGLNCGPLAAGAKAPATKKKKKKNGRERK